MSKKKSKGNSKKTKYEYSVLPEFKRHIEEMNKNVIDFSNAPDELRLSDRILRLIDPYMESMDIILLIDCATIAWNECVHEDFGFKDSYSLNNMLLNFAKYRGLIEELKLRKRRIFKNNSRHIKQIKVYQKDDGISINVASSFDIRDVFSKMLSLAKDEPYETYPEIDDEFYSGIESYNNDSNISKANPHIKRTLLEVVDNQIYDNDPPITRETFERLQQRDVLLSKPKKKLQPSL